MPLRVIRFDDVDSFLERAEGWLRQAEAENNLILGVAHQVRRGDHPFEEPIYLAAVVENESIVTCAFRTPPFKLGLTRAPESAIPRLVRDVREVYGSLPGVLGPEPAAVQFAELWTLEFGGEWERGMRQGIYALEEVISPSKPAPGGLRLATDADLPLVLDWAEAFIRFAGVPAGNLERLTRTLVRSESMFFWEDGEPRSMAGVTGNTPNGAQALDVATVTKLVRNLGMLIIIPLTSIIYHRNSADAGEGHWPETIGHRTFFRGAGRRCEPLFDYHAVLRHRQTNY